MRLAPQNGTGPQPPGRYRIEIPALGISFEHIYPVNRCAKILDLVGIGGTVTIRDRKTGMVRMVVDISMQARQMFSENQIGFKWGSWTEHSLRALEKHAQAVRRALKERRNAHLGGPIPLTPNRVFLMAVPVKPERVS